MKRIISLFSCLVIVAACFVVPVSADSDFYDDDLLNLIDYGNAIESDDNTIEFKNTGVLNYELPDETLVSYVDVVFNFWGSGGSPSPETISIIRNGSSVWSTLKFSKISTYMYRAYGTFSQKAFKTIGFQVKTNKPDEECQFTIEQFNVGLFSQTVDVLSANAVVYSNGKTASVTHTADSHGFYYWEVAGDNTEADFSFDIWNSDNWRKYDYIDFSFGCEVADINSISVKQNGTAVPFDVSFVDSTGLSSSWYIVVVRIDLTGIDRSSASNYPIISVTGNSHFISDNAIIISDVIGRIKYEAENPIIFWFKKTYSSIVDGFQNVVNAIVGGSEEVDQVGDQMQSAADDLNQGANAFDQVETPDINASDLTGELTNFSPSGLTVLATITNNSYVTALLVLVFTFALCAYIFFGRKR